MVRLDAAIAERARQQLSLITYPAARRPRLHRADAPHLASQQALLVPDGAPGAPCRRGRRAAGSRRPSPHDSTSGLHARRVPPDGRRALGLPRHRGPVRSKLSVPASRTSPPDGTWPGAPGRRRSARRIGAPGCHRSRSPHLIGPSSTSPAACGRGNSSPILDHGHHATGFCSLDTVCSGSSIRLRHTGPAGRPPKLDAVLAAGRRRAAADSWLERSLLRPHGSGRSPTSGTPGRAPPQTGSHLARVDALYRRCTPW